MSGWPLELNRHNDRNNITRIWELQCEPLDLREYECAPGVALRGTDMPAARSRGGGSALRLGLTGPRLQHFTKTKTNRSFDAAAKKGLFSLFFAPFSIQGERPEACPTAHREGV